MIRPSCPTTAVDSVCVMLPVSACDVTPKNLATSSTCADVPVASVHCSKRLRSFRTDFTVSAENRGRVEFRVECDAEQRHAAADAFLVSAAPDRFEVPDHQRAEVRQRAARIYKGDDQDPAGEVPHRDRAGRPDRAARTAEDHTGDRPARGRTTPASAAASRGDRHVFEPAPALRHDQSGRDTVPSRTAGARRRPRTAWSWPA